MNDQDLERQLRSQRSPREAGYTPAQLPMTLEEARAKREPAPILRAGMFVGAAAAGALAVAVVAVILSGPSHNGVGGGTSPSPSASPTAAASVAPGACAPGDVILTAEPWGGAAGSRGTVVTVKLAPGAAQCDLPKAIHGEIVDANGTHLVKGVTSTTDGSVALAPDASFQVGVAWSNWCDSQPAAPMTLFFGFGNQVPSPVGTAGSVPASAVPPCNGSGPSSLSLTDLQPAP
ncbi:MAG TPA: hypothetical protein VK600_01990 [Candidatus Saccharimonadales bacterium]|nr:hypothetical protein [Candidatus Saccharimonadales bacterium]